MCGTTKLDLELFNKLLYSTKSIYSTPLPYYSRNFNKILAFISKQSCSSSISILCEFVVFSLASCCLLVVPYLFTATLHTWSELTLQGAPGCLSSCSRTWDSGYLNSSEWISSHPLNCTFTQFDLISTIQSNRASSMSS